MPTVPPTTSEGMLDDDALYREQYGEEPDGGSETCGHVVERTGEECGRELPCQYHDD